MKIKTIESESNSVYKKLLSLSKSRGLNKEGECLVPGEKIIAEVLKDQLVDLKNSYWVYFSDEHEIFDSKNSPDSLVQLPKPLFKEVDVVGTNYPLLCVPVPEIQDWNPEQEATGPEALCALGDPNNLGALMRSAEAFGIKSIVLLEEACHPYHPKVIKASAGSCFRLQIFSGPSIQNLESVRHIFALDGGGVDLSQVSFPKNPRLLLGEEGMGLPQGLKVQKVAIRISPQVESLNATVAASILFYELSKIK